MSATSTASATAVARDRSTSRVCGGCSQQRRARRQSSRGPACASPPVPRPRRDPRVRPDRPGSTGRGRRPLRREFTCPGRGETPRRRRNVRPPRARLEGADDRAPTWPAAGRRRPPRRSTRRSGGVLARAGRRAARSRRGSDRGRAALRLAGRRDRPPGLAPSDERASGVRRIPSGARRRGGARARPRGRHAAAAWATPTSTEDPARRRRRGAQNAAENWQRASRGSPTVRPTARSRTTRQPAPPAPGRPRDLDAVDQVGPAEATAGQRA